MANTIAVASLSPVSPGSEFQLVVNLTTDPPAAIFAADLLFRYNPAQLQLLDATQGDLAATSGWNTLANTATAGLLRTSQQGATALAGGSGSLLVLRFRALPAASGLLTVDLDQQSSIGLNEGTVAFSAIDGTVQLQGSNPSSGPSTPGGTTQPDPALPGSDPAASNQPAANQSDPSRSSERGSDTADKRIVGLAPGDPITGTDASESLIPTTAGSYTMTGKGGADRFFFAVAEQRNRDNADLIVDYASQEGDTLVLYARAVGINNIKFKVAKNSKQARRLYSTNTNLIYLQSKGHLLVDLNGSKPGLGPGGLMAIFSNNASLKDNSFELLQELPPVTF